MKQRSGKSVECHPEPEAQAAYQDLCRGRAKALVSFGIIVMIHRGPTSNVLWKENEVAQASRIISAPARFLTCRLNTAGRTYQDGDAAWASRSRTHATIIYIPCFDHEN